MSIAETVLKPLLGFPLMLNTIILSILLTVIVTYLYKWFSNQELMKKLKEQIKTLQQKSKETTHQEEILKINKELMQVNSQMMLENFKPKLMLGISLPLLIIFTGVVYPWMQEHYAFEPLKLGKDITIEVTTTKPGIVEIQTPDGLTLTSQKQAKAENTAKFSIIPTKEGNHQITFKYDTTTIKKDIIVTTERKYTNPTETYNSDIKSIKINHEKAIALNLFGWKLGWLGTYVLISIILSSALRKILKIY
ncbi:DUF106 domain-containing protein [Candidatus Woesearchaeota archaeon]|nr:DUF106 domain-containing protein [Candidatus Woesearchaeota archaeon]